MTSPVPENLAAALDELGYVGSEGLLTTADGLTPDTPSEVSSRAYLWRDLDLRVGLDAAFFHDGVPLVGFSDRPTGEGLLDLRKRLWNYGRVPILIVSTDEDTKAYNSVNLPVPPDQGQPALTNGKRQQSTATSLLNAFSRRNVEAGQFAHTFEESYRKTNRVDQGLLFNLRFLRRSVAGSDLKSQAGLDVLVAVTASYLAHRNVLDEAHMEELCGVSTLDQALIEGRATTTALFAGLAERFKGDVFGSVEQAIADLNDAAFDAVASLLRGDNLPTGQPSLWPYDFAGLPARSGKQCL